MEQSSFSLCACGCGQALETLDARGRPRRFLHGHNGRGVPLVRRPDPLPCACGCGRLAGPGKRFVHGHWPRRPLVERFWEKVVKTPTCWLWTAAAQGGYGVIGDPHRKGRVLRAHRVSWELHDGPIPSGMDVLHRCDTPACVRPDHLFLGTAADNIADMFAKGRQPDRRAPRNRPLQDS